MPVAGHTGQVSPVNVLTPTAYGIPLMKKINIPLLVLATMMLAGCLSPGHPAPKIDFYTLEYDPVCVRPASPLPAVLDIQRFSIVPDYNTMRIVFKDTPFQRNEYVYHRWHADPADLVSSFLSRDLQASGLFLAVNAPESPLPATHMLSGSVNAFYEHDLPHGWEAVLGMTITLSRANEPDITKRILFQRCYRTTRPCGTRTPASVAQAMSEAMKELSANIQNDVAQAIAKDIQAAVDQP